MSDSPPPAGPLVFGDFLEHLRRQGFTIGVGDYLRLQQVLNQVSGDCAPSDLKTLLCPLLATNKLQQEQFHAAFDTYFDLFQNPTPKTEASRGLQEDIPIITAPPKPRAARKWLYVLAGAILLALSIVLVVFMNRRTEPNKEPLSNQLPAPVSQPHLEQPKLLPPPQPKKPEENFYQRYGNTIYLCVIFAPLVFFLIYEWRRFNRRKLMLEKQRGKKPPFVWPLKVEASAAKLYDPEPLYAAARLMRRRQVGEFQRLDIDATVVATIAARGFPHFCYKLVSKPPEYLILIERRSFRDHQARLFDELAKALEGEGVFIARCFYDGDPRVCRDGTGVSVDLVELQNKYGEHRLLIFGNGEKLINPITGKLETWAAMFADWPARALLTPEAPSQWGLKEITLAEQFILLPATLEGLLAGVDYFELPVATDLRAWQQTRVTAPPSNLEPPDVVDRLRRYLGEAAFQWLCACAIYPELHWDLTLYLGSLACMPKGLVKEAQILKLIRLPWFRSGAMPDDVRWLLIRQLDREKEQAIRAAIIELMEKNPPPKETFAADAYQLNLVVQQWLFHPERKRRRQMLQVLNTLPQSRAARDYTLLRFLESARPSALDFFLPRRLRRLFYRQGIPAFGLKTGLRLLGALAVSAIALLLYLTLYYPGTLSTPHSTSFSSGDLAQRNIALRANRGSCFDCHNVTMGVQNKCFSCHTTSRFNPTLYGAHLRENLACSSCHAEHQGKEISLGLVSYELCSNCHNGAYKIKTGDNRGKRLPVPHGGPLSYPVVNGQWKWKLTADQIRQRGWPDTWANYESSDQFHAVHQLGRMVNSMSCGDCHTRGVVDDKADWKTSPRDECAKCHFGPYMAADAQTGQVACSYCHNQHGLESDLAKITDAKNAAAPSPLPIVDSRLIEEPLPFDHNRKEHQTKTGDCVFCHRPPGNGEAPKLPGHWACSDCHQRDFVSKTSQLCTVCHKVPVDEKGTLISFPANLKQSDFRPGRPTTRSR